MAADKKTVSGTVHFTHNNEAKSAGFTTTFTRLPRQKLRVVIKVNAPGGRIKTYTTDWSDHTKLPPDADGRSVVHIYARDILPRGAVFRSVN